jgi:hypothetical protein
MSPVRGKSNLQKYTEALERYNKKYAKLETMNPGKTMDKVLYEVEDLSEKVDKLKLIKDNPTLSDTCKRRLAQIYTEETTGRKKDIQSIYLEKGLMTEEDSITLYSMILGKMYRKNRERVSNGYVTGEIDFDDPETDTVVDTKSSFDIFSFDLTAALEMKKIYEWQGHMYMWLKNRKNFRLAYCLNDTPPVLLSRLKKQLYYNFVGSEEDLKEAESLLEQNHKYQDLPLERRIRIYDLKRDDEKIDMAKMYITYFREYLKNFRTTKIEDYEQDTE